MIATIRRAAPLLGLLMLMLSANSTPRQGVHAHATTLDGDFPGGYQCAAADIDGDGKPDVIGLGGTVAWLHNGDWKKRPITGSQTRGNIDIAPYDIDGDGKLEVVVASDFDLNDSQHGGTLQWFKRTADLDQAWTPHFIDAEPTAHRIRWADVEGTGRRMLVDVPILGKGAKGPAYNQAPAPLALYRIPANLGDDAWQKTVIDQTMHVTHGIEVVDIDGDGRDELLTASFEGVHLFRFTGHGHTLAWTKTRLCKGEQATSPARGSSEVRLGHLKGGRRFIATIEPWHGDEVVVYLSPPVADPGAPLWERHVIDSSLNEGHALATLDVDGDGNDEIIAGFRGKARGVVAYRLVDLSGTHWERSVLDDGGIAAQGFSLADFLGTGKKQLVAIGGATHNMKLFDFGAAAR